MSKVYRHSEMSGGLEVRDARVDAGEEAGEASNAGGQGDAAAQFLGSGPAQEAAVFISRVASELLKRSANIAMTYVPYRGTPQAITDLLGGQIDVFFADPFAGISLVNEGQLKVLAVTDTKRLPLLPQVPTMAEAGYKDVEVVSWAAMFAPAKTDPSIVNRLSREINQILAEPGTQEFFHRMGATPMPMPPSELRGFVTSEIARWAKLIEIANIPKK